MKTKFILIALFFSTSMAAQTKEEPIAVDKIQNVVIDGEKSDWSDAMSYFDEKSGLMYGIAADDENLYVLVEATDKLAQRKFTGGGVEVWISTDNKEKRQTGIKFPIPMSWEERRAMREQQAASGDSERRKISGSAYKTMELRGFNNIENDTYAIDATAIKAQYGNEGENSIVEYKIPFSTFINAENKTSQPIAIGIALNGMQMGGRGPGGGGGRGGFGGGRPGGMGGGNGTHRERLDMRKMAESTIFWVYVNL